jgi:hypothetical protein
MFSILIGNLLSEELLQLEKIFLFDLLGENLGLDKW